MAAETQRERRDRAKPAPGQPARQQGDHDQEDPNAQPQGEVRDKTSARKEKSDIQR